SRGPIGQGKDGKDVFLKDIWPTNQEISDTIMAHVSSKMFRSRYANVFEGDKNWQSVKTSTGDTFEWDPKSTYIRLPPYFEGIDKQGTTADFKVADARILLLLGDSVTTDHISPAGDIKATSPAGKY